MSALCGTFSFIFSLLLHQHIISLLNLFDIWSNVVSNNHTAMGVVNTMEIYSRVIELKKTVGI